MQNDRPRERTTSIAFRCCGSKTERPCNSPARDYARTRERRLSRTSRKKDAMKHCVARSANLWLSGIRSRRSFHSLYLFDQPAPGTSPAIFIWEFFSISLCPLPDTKFGFPLDCRLIQHRVKTENIADEHIIYLRDRKSVV